MLFNSLAFAIFLPLVFALYWAAGRNRLRLQNTLLLVASYVFYGWWDWRFLSLIVISSIVDYWAGIRLYNAEKSSHRRLLLTFSLAVNLGFLGVFKYYDFFVTSMVNLLTSAGLQPNVHTLGIILPVGISFYTFQTLSYSLDIYRKKLEPTHDPIAFFAFVSFFPQLVAGPIERASHLLPQFETKRNFDVCKAEDGLRQILWGLVKKVVVADNAARSVDLIFGDPGSYSPPMLLAGVFLFALQIYGDFSGYSDIAIGTSRLFGFSLMQNFAFPYFSRDIAEFWRRWHISLSSWFRDYVFIPLGGSRGGKWLSIRNIVITFTVSGLWHGANWTFVIWGLLNGLAYVPLMLLDKNKDSQGTVAENRIFPSVNEIIKMGGTFSFTLLAWVFFRATDVSHALFIIERLFTTSWMGPLNSGLVPLHVAYGLILLMCEWPQRTKQHALQITHLPRPVRWLLYSTLLVVLFVFGFWGETTFIYFQF
ncbi:MAG: MBOAT family protein [bacterium]|nr:MBOAT family protein [bacterium]